MKRVPRHSCAADKPFTHSESTLANTDIIYDFSHSGNSINSLFSAIRQTGFGRSPQAGFSLSEPEEKTSKEGGKIMKVLIVEPMKPCYVREISGLNDMQEIVGGHIEAIYPFKEQVAIIANEEGKILGLPFNRPLSDERGVPYDIVCGTFFMAGLGSEDFTSLTDDQIRRYKKMFDNRMVFTVPAKAQAEKNHPKKGKSHER
ncbi:DUF3846 domain-containing protein [Flavonifractor plautii]|uniref:DUF3846 domain-containing protein n=1 Tax=Flavonifractor plautii TaxID=292800 RepID=UPI003EEC3240